MESSRSLLRSYGSNPTKSKTQFIYNTSTQITSRDSEESGLQRENGKDLNVADILEDQNSSVSSNAEYKNLQDDIEMVISTLKEREQEVLRMRYGIGNTTRRTLEEIGNIYGVTKECIRQTEMRALKKMRTSTLGQEILSAYIG